MSKIPRALRPGTGYDSRSRVCDRVHNLLKSSVADPRHATAAVGPGPGAGPGYGPAARDYPTLKYVPGDMDALAAIPREMEVFLRKRVAAPELNISFCDV